MQAGLHVGGMELLRAIGRADGELPIATPKVCGSTGKTADSAVLQRAIAVKGLSGIAYGNIVVNLAKTGKPANIFRRQ